ncbi:MAG: OsmC family protein [Clostridia bacterium]|nr:OsmC family protein [Clostridia bacterium]
MKSSFSTKWVSDMAFETEISGHKILMDASEDVGGHDQGPRPKPLIIAALTGCTGMDVVSILKKMRVEIESFNMSVETEMTEEHPKTYSKIHMVYEFTGKDLDPAKIEKAVSLSQDRYCGVSELLKKGLELTYEIKIN